MKKLVIIGLIIVCLGFGRLAQANDAEKFAELAKKEGLVSFFKIKAGNIVGQPYLSASGRLFYVMPVFDPDGRMLGFITEFASGYQSKGDIVLALNNILTGMAGFSPSDKAVLSLVCDLATIERFDETKFFCGTISGETRWGEIMGLKSRFINFRLEE